MRTPGLRAIKYCAQGYTAIKGQAWETELSPSSHGLLLQAGWTFYSRKRKEQEEEDEVKSGMRRRKMWSTEESPEVEKMKMMKPLLAVIMILRKTGPSSLSHERGAGWGVWRLKQRSERVTLGMQCESVQRIRSPSEQLWSKTHLGSNPSSDIPDLCDFGQGTSLLYAKVSSPGKQDNSSTYHIGGGEDWTAWPMWKHWGWGWGGGGGKVWPTESRAACHWFCMAYKLKMVFTFLNSWENIKRRMFCDIWKLYEIQILLSINMVSIGLWPCPFISLLSFTAFAWNGNWVAATETLCGTLTALHCCSAHCKWQWGSENVTAFWVTCVSSICVDRHFQRWNT